MPAPSTPPRKSASGEDDRAALKSVSTPACGVRILIVDDHAEFVESASELIRQDSRFEIVGVARSGEDAILLSKQLAPDVVLMDLSLPGMNGLESTRHIKRLRPAPRVIIVSLHSNHAYREAAVEAGADDFLSKQQLTEALAATIAKVAGDNRPPFG